MTSLADRADNLRVWARSRIEHCRELELKFGTSWQLHPKHQSGPPQTLVEAWAERRALQAVLELLEDPGPDQ